MSRVGSCEVGTSSFLGSLRCSQNPIWDGIMRPKIAKTKNMAIIPNELEFHVVLVCPKSRRENPTRGHHE